MPSLDLHQHLTSPALCTDVDAGELVSALPLPPTCHLTGPHMQQSHLAELPGSDALVALQFLRLAGLAWPASAAPAAAAWICSPVVITQGIQYAGCMTQHDVCNCRSPPTPSRPQNAGLTSALKAASAPG